MKHDYEHGNLSGLRSARSASNSVSIRERDEVLADLADAKQTLNFEHRSQVFARRARVAVIVYGCVAVLIMLFAAGGFLPRVEAIAFLGVSAAAWLVALRFRTGTVPLYVSFVFPAMLTQSEYLAEVERIRAGAGAGGGSRFVIVSLLFAAAAAIQTLSVHAEMAPLLLCTLGAAACGAVGAGAIDGARKLWRMPRVLLRPTVLDALVSRAWDAGATQITSADAVWMMAARLTERSANANHAVDSD